jgi:type II secretory pathway component PulM
MCRQSIEAALFKTMACQSNAMKNADVTVRAGMAFPNTPHYRDSIGRIARSLEAANISVFLLNVQGGVKQYQRAIAFLNA